MLLHSHYTSLLLCKMATKILYIMKNKLKLVTLVLIITHCMLCGSLNAQQGMSIADLYDQQYKETYRKRQEEFNAKFAKQKAQEEQEKAQKMKLREENIRAGLITGGILAIPLIIVSTTLIISRIKENRA